MVGYISLTTNIKPTMKDGSLEICLSLMEPSGQVSRGFIIPAANFVASYVPFQQTFETKFRLENLLKFGRSQLFCTQTIDLVLLFLILHNFDTSESVGPVWSGFLINSSWLSLYLLKACFFPATQPYIFFL